MNVPPLYKLNRQGIVIEPEVWALACIALLFIYVPLLYLYPIVTVAATVVPLAISVMYVNRNIYTAYKNGHTEYTSVEVNVLAKNSVYHSMESYDPELLDVEDDIRHFFDEAGGVTPITSNIWQQKSSNIAFTGGTRYKRKATITVNFGYDPQEVNFDDLVDNLETAIQKDDRIKEFRSVELDVVKEDFRETVDCTRDDYGHLGRDVDVRTGLSGEEERLVEEAEEEFHSK